MTRYLSLLALLISINAFSASGEWTKLYEGDGKADRFFASGNSICADKSGNVIVAGYATQNGGGKDIWINKYSGQGVDTWTKFYSGKEGKDDAASGVAVDADGNIYVCGYETVKGPKKNIWIGKYDPEGKEIWTKSFGVEFKGDCAANCIAVDAKNNICVGGYISNKNYKPDAWVAKFDPEGKEFFSEKYNGKDNGADEIKGIAVDAEGNIIVGGYESQLITSKDIWVRKYSSEGKSAWDYQYSGLAKKEDVVNALVLDSKGNIFIAGYEDKGTVGKDAFIKKLDPSGTEKAAINYNSMNNLDDAINGLYIDAEDNIYACGYETTRRQAKNCWMRRYGKDLKDTMARTYDNAEKDDIANGIVKIENGIIVTGFITVKSTEVDAWTRKYLP